MRRLRSTARLRRITNTVSTPISAANQVPTVLQIDDPVLPASSALPLDVLGLEVAILGAVEVLVTPVAPETAAAPRP